MREGRNKKMINTKALYYSLLNDERITALVGNDNIFDAYPNTVETFPCIIYLDENQNDVEFADNQPLANDITVQIHIFTKALENYYTTFEIGSVVARVMAENFFACTQNGESPDPDADVRHRVMTFRKVVLS